MRLRLVGPCTLSACLFAITTPLAAQNASPRDSVRDDARFSFYARGPYRPNVPKPETILGYEVGAFNTQFALQERTLLAIADAARDRVRVEEIGSTNERRTMRIYIISSPEKCTMASSRSMTRRVPVRLARVSERLCECTPHCWCPIRLGL